MSSIPSLYAQG